MAIFLMLRGGTMEGGGWWPNMTLVGLRGLESTVQAEAPERADPGLLLEPRLDPPTVDTTREPLDVNR
jgi:hypothetical protein